jgi:hypothetical protein
MIRCVNRRIRLSSIIYNVLKDNGHFLQLYTIASLGLIIYISIDVLILLTTYSVRYYLINSFSMSGSDPSKVIEQLHEIQNQYLGLGRNGQDDKLLAVRLKKRTQMIV